MATPSQETIDVLEGLKGEIAANGVLMPQNNGERGYNQGIFRAVEFINRYIAGDGLFQLAAKAKSDDE